MADMRGKRVVVTGGAGFIGSNLAEGFSRENEVVVVDDLSTGKLENIKPLITAKRVKFVRGDACDYRFMRKACDNADFVLHYAAIPSVPLSVKDPILVNRSGVDATLSTLLAARDAGVSKVVFASSSAVYGDTKSLPIREDAPLKPLSPYAVTKITGELYCRLFDELYGLETVCLRFFNIFGPRQDPKSEYAAVVPKFIVNALSGKTLTIHGDGTQTRNFLFVKDVLLANKLATKKGATGVYNISSGRKVTINNLAKTVQRLTRTEVSVCHGPPRKGEILRSEADVARAKRVLGFEPQYSLEDGLRETIDSFQAQKR